MDQKDIDLLKAEAALLNTHFTIYNDTVIFHGYVPMVLADAPSIRDISFVALEKMSALNDPDVVMQFQHIELISFKFVVPETIGLFVGLKVLKLSHIQSEKLPDSLWELKNLSTLIFHECNIQQLPKSIENLTNLKHLEIFDAQLTSLPNSIGNLKNLKHLEIAYCKNLIALPDSIGNLTNLHYLVVSFCDVLKTIPVSIGLLQNLSRLEFYNTPMISLPKSIGNLKNLNYLNICLGENPDSIPESIGNLKSLEIMAITICSINRRKFPDIFDSMIGLKVILIFDSKIILPQSFYRLSSRGVSITHIDEIDFAGYPFV